ncbi:MAG: PAS domain-containing protein [Bacteroidales bacterium]|nr:PAS domain-containing protein [Bacteroidales bacterium]MBN2748536.1 PAS domain-containing protein [Bacteroidales bacterium]
MNRFFKLRIRTKVLVFVLITTIGVFALIGAFISLKTSKLAVDNALSIAKGHAEKVANAAKSEIELDLGFSRALAQSFATYHLYDTTTRDSIFYNIIKSQAENNPRYVSVWTSLEYFAFKPNYTKSYGRRSVTAYLKHGTTLITEEDKNLTGDVVGSGYQIAKALNKEIVLDPYTFTLDGNTEILGTSVCVPVQRNGLFVGLAGVDIELTKFQKSIEQVQPYKNTIAFLLSNNATIIAHTNPAIANQLFGHAYPQIEAEQLIQNKVRRGTGANFYSEINGIEYDVLIEPISLGSSNTPWAIGLLIPTKEIKAEAQRTIMWGILVAAIGIALLGYVLWIIAGSITNPIIHTTELLNNLAQGDIDQSKKLDIKTGDELESMASSVNKLIDGLNTTEIFAREIGKGNLDAEFSLLGEKDILGISLLEMQKSLKHARQLEQERKEEEEKQNWATHGIAIFGDILRQNNNNLEELSYSIIQNLVSYVNANQGGLFVENKLEGEETKLEMTACYAFDRRKFLEKHVIPGEGLIGRCFQEGKTIFMTDLPKNYINITSGLGKENPRCLILVPLRINDDILGVIEIASFTILEKHQIEFIEKVAASIASTLSSVKINIRTAELLAKSQQQAEEMAAQEEEMRQNMEELQATQEEMERKKFEQEQIQESLGQEKALLDALMYNIPDFVYFKDENSRFLRISSSMVKLFHAENPEDLIGKSDFDFHSREHAEKAFTEEQEVIRSQAPIVDHVVKETFDDGREQWVSTTKMPLFDALGNVIGVWGISKIVTDLKKAEMEANQRANEAMELQKKIDSTQGEYKALVKAIDATTYVVHYTPDGFISLANDQMVNILGTNVTDIVGKHQSEIFGMGESPEQQNEFWNDLRNGVVRQRNFKSKRVALSETYSPVTNAKGKVEKIICIAVRG